MNWCCIILLAGAVAAGQTAEGQPFRLPTANRALFEPGGDARYFVGTPGRTWEAGTYGCVRSEGTQLHEGVDIGCVKRDAKGEPADPILSTADGVVVYVNRRPSLSNYGNYVVVQHLVEGMDIFGPQVVRYSHPGRVLAGHQAGPIGRANGGRSIGVRESHALSGHKVQAWGFVERVAIAPQLCPAQVVGEHHDDVRSTSHRCSLLSHRTSGVSGAALDAYGPRHR